MERDVLTKITVESLILGETRKLTIFRGKGLDREPYGERTYLPIIVLDGEVYAEIFHHLLAFSTGGGYRNWSLPEIVLIFITNSDRTRDMTFPPSSVGFDGNHDVALTQSGGGERFLDFLALEVMPTVSNLVSVHPYWSLFGHSFGGLLALHMITQPTCAFSACIASDPSLWWANAHLPLAVKRQPPDPVTFAHRRIYMSEAGDRIDLKGPTRNFAGAIQLFADGLDRAGIDYRRDIFADETHGSIPLVSFYNGLHYLFDYRRERAKDGGTGSLIDAYDAMSRRLGVTVAPPPEHVAIAIEGALARNDFDEAIILADANARNFPGSTKARAELAAVRARASENAAAAAATGGGMPAT